MDNDIGYPKPFLYGLRQLAGAIGCCQVGDDAFIGHRIGGAASGTSQNLCAQLTKKTDGCRARPARARRDQRPFAGQREEGRHGAISRLAILSPSSVKR